MNQTKIYALLDPISSEVRYVGKTHLTLAQRLNHHMKGSCAYPVGKWVYSFAPIERSPVIVELEGGLGDFESREVEAFWIKYFLFIGANLLNRQHNGWTFGLKRRTRWDA